METYAQLPYKDINHPAKKLNRLFKSEILNIKSGFRWWKYSQSYTIAYMQYNLNKLIMMFENLIILS